MEVSETGDYSRELGPQYTEGGGGKNRNQIRIK